jgi:PAS domain S-box-containing protein
MRRYALAILIVAAAAGVRLSLLSALGGRAVFVTFFPAVAIAALFGGFSGGLLATILSAGIAALWLEPVGRLWIQNPADWLSMAVFLMGCMLISITCEAMHRAQARADTAEGQARLADESARAESELRQSEARYRSLFENMLNGFAYCRMLFDQDRPRDFIYLDVNGAFEKLTGLKNVVGKKVSEVIPGIRDDDPELFEFYGRVAMTGIPERLEHYSKALKMWFEVSVYSPEKEHFVVIFDVITERKRTAEALRESEHRFRGTFENAAVGFANVSLDNRFTRLNQRFCEIAGYPEEELLNKTWQEITHPQDLEADLDQYSKLRDGLIDSYQMEKRYVRKDGSPIWIDLTGSVQRDQLGRPEYYIAVIEDITARKRAEEALRESEERYRRLFEEATEGIAMADAESGEILDCNRAFLLLTGYGRHELIGKPQTMLYPKEEVDARLSRTFLNHRDRKNGAVLTARLVTKSGAVKQVEIKVNTLDLGGRKVLQGIFRDVTEELRYQHERETTLKLLGLLNDHNNTRELIRNLTGFLQEWTGCEAVGVRLQTAEDYPYFETRGFPPKFVEAENYLCSRDEHGQLVRDFRGNPVLECMCGNVLCGRSDPALPFFTPKGSFWTNCTTELLGSTSEADRQGRTRNRCNGEGYESVALFALRHGGRTIGLLQINDRARDRFTPELITFLENAADQITIALAQRQAQTALRESEERYRVLVENAAEAIVVLQDGVIRFVNPEAEVQSGYSREELTEKPFLEFVHPEDRERLAANHRRRIGGEPVNDGEEARIVRKDGTVGRLNIKGTRILWRGAPATLNLCTDVTERKRAEDEKEKLEAQLFQAQKMESVGRLAGGVAHDFNNMLNVITGYAELALKEVDPGGPLYHDLQEIQNAGQRSADLTRQLLAFARKQTISPKMLDLNDTIEGMLKMLRRLIGENLNLTWNPGHALWNVTIDPSQIDQILANLAVNARDAISGIGQVAIETANVVLDEHYCAQHVGSVPGDYVLIALSDTGAGMSKEVLEHIFEPFFTTKEAGKGTGLGLATVYGIVKQNNGFIDVLSEPAKGTTFKLFLPRTLATAGPTAAAEAAKKVRGGTETILRVEDSLPLLNLGRKILESLGYTVLLASTPQRAMELARVHAEDIRLLITDVVMPEMNGRQLFDRLCAVKSGIKCLYMSGYTADVIAHQGVLEEGTNFIQKPFVRDQFAAKIRAVLEET